ncbi:MAG: MFS transporter [Acidimicrobiales bacterium]
MTTGIGTGAGTGSEVDSSARMEPLPRNVKVLGAVSLAQDTGSEMMYPLLPSFVTGTLGAPVVAVGVAEGVADAIASTMKLVAGRLGDRRRRRWIAAGYAIATVGKIVVAAALVWPVVILGRAIDRVGKGIRGVPRDALIAADTSAAMRGRAFGYHRSLDTIGAVLGPLLGLALLQVLDGRIRVALAVAVVPAAISVGLVAFVREPGAPPTPAGADAAHAAPPDPGAVAPDRPQVPAGVWRVLAPLIVFALVNSTDALLLQHAGDVGLSTTQVVAVYVGFNVVYAALGYPAGTLADRLPPRLLFAIGLVVFAAVYIGLGQSASATVVWVLLPVYGIFPALTDGISRAWISNLAPDRARTWVLGVHGATTGFAVLVAGLWSGLAWGERGELPLTISGIVAAAVAIWLVLDRGTGPQPVRA